MFVTNIPFWILKLSRKGRQTFTKKGRQADFFAGRSVEEEYEPLVFQRYVQM